MKNIAMLMIVFLAFCWTGQSSSSPEAAEMAERELQRLLGF